MCINFKQKLYKITDIKMRTQTYMGPKIIFPGIYRSLYSMEKITTKRKDSLEWNMLTINIGSK
jgi:hypothetical protein